MMTTSTNRLTEPDRPSDPVPPPSINRARALFLVAAFLSFLASVALYFGGNETEGIFVGLWVPSILALGGFLAPAEARR